MAIGERIRFFRNLCGMTQKYLGQVVGFPEKTADIRMAQYESGSRTPKIDLTNKLAEVFDISPQALSVPDIDSYVPHIRAVFGLLERQDARYIPFSLADQGRRHFDPLALALEALIGLPTSRFAASDLLDLLESQDGEVKC